MFQVLVLSLVPEQTYTEYPAHRKASSHITHKAITRYLLSEVEGGRYIKGGIEIYWPEGKVKYKRKGDVLNFRDVDSLINLQTLHPPKLQINDEDIWGKINLSSLVPSLPALIEYV